MSSRRRRRSSGMQPFMSAGLLMFRDVKEIERVKIPPTVTILIGLAVPIVIILLYLLVPI
ncbi:MAG: preprotein translocase subunit SecG [Caldivirga sp.]|jgi:preprotein translocase subunit Sec61beta